LGVNRYGGDCIVGVEIPEMRVNGFSMPAALPGISGCTLGHAMSSR